MPFPWSKSGQLIEEEPRKEAEKVGGSPEGVAISKKKRVSKAAEVMEKKSEEHQLDLARWTFCKASRRAALVADWDQKRMGLRKW